MAIRNVGGFAGIVFAFGRFLYRLVDCFGSRPLATNGVNLVMFLRVLFALPDGTFVYGVLHLFPLLLGDFQFVDIPVQALFNFKLSESFALQLLAGPCFSINVGGNMKRTLPTLADMKFSDIYSAFQMGGQAGLRLVIAKHYAIGADYQMGFGNYKNYNFGVNVGYIF